MAVRPTPPRPAVTRPTLTQPTVTRPTVTPPTVTTRDGTDAGLTLEINFRVTVSNREIAVAAISPLELAADPDGLKQVAAASRGGGPVWTAPPVPGRLVMRRALDGDRTFYEWRREAIDGKPAVRTVGIRQLDRAAKTTVNAWQLVNAWPLRWTGPTFDALYGGIAQEEIELAFTDLNWL